MKTNYMIALSTQWKAPWRKPTVDISMDAGTAAENMINNKLQHKLGETVKGVQDFIKKYWLND